MTWFFVALGFVAFIILVAAAGLITFTEIDYDGSKYRRPHE
jgi:hypothetical protein